MSGRREKGTGSIRARGRRWQAAYYARSADGSRRQITSRHGTKTAAKEWLRDELHKSKNGVVAQRDLTLGEFLTDWLKSRSVTQLKPNTQTWYRSAVENHIVPNLGDMVLQKVTATKLEAFYTDRESHGRLDGKGGLSQTSVRRFHVTLYRAFDSAKKQGLLEGNPAERVDGKPSAKRADLSEKVWTPEELHLFLESVGNDPHEVLWEVTALTGLRRGEVLGLRWSDVNLDEGELSVRRTWVMVGGSPRESSPKTPGSRRSVSLDTRTLAALRSHKVRQNELRLKSGQVWQDLGVVFTREDGSHLRPDWVSRRFRKLVAEAGLPRIPFHGLRHSHATALLAAAQNPKVVQERLGHYSAAFTLDCYAAVLPNMQRDAAEKVATLVHENESIVAQ